MSIDDSIEYGRNLSKTNFALKNRKRVTLNPDHVDDPKKRYEGKYNPDLAYKEIMKKIGKNGDCYGSKDPDFFMDG